MRAKKPQSPPQKGRIFSKIAQAASALGLSPDTLKAIKDKGCDAFTGSGRIDEAKLLKWISEHPDAMQGGPMLTLKDQKISEEIRKLRIANDAKEGALVSRSKVVEAIVNAASEVDLILEAKIVNEWPEAVAGLDVSGARVYGRRLSDAVMAKIRKLEELWHF